MEGLTCSGLSFDSNGWMCLQPTSLTAAGGYRCPAQADISSRLDTLGASGKQAGNHFQPLSVQASAFVAACQHMIWHPAAYRQPCCAASAACIRMQSAMLGAYCPHLSLGPSVQRLCVQLSLWSAELKIVQSLSNT